MDYVENCVQFTDVASNGEEQICILWADVVGFSGLSIALADELDGRELITQAIGALIARCLGISQQLEAVPISLGGDSWTVAWPVSSAKNGDAAAQLGKAAIAAEAAHKLCETLTVRYGFEIKLRIACALGSGRRFRVALGDSRENLILRGDVILMAGELLRQCMPGQSLFSQNVTAKQEMMLGENNKFEQATLPAALGAMQRGVCTVMFVAIRIAHLNSLAADALILLLAQEARELCAQFGARCARIRVDEKGCNVLIMLGLGSFASTNDSKHAISIARMLQVRLAAHVSDLGVGVCSGRVFACEVGHGRMVEFTAMGECVNLAAQVAAQNPGGIWLDTTSIELADCADETSVFMDVVTKGAQSTQRMFRLSSSGHGKSVHDSAMPLQVNAIRHIVRDDTILALHAFLKQHKRVCVVGDSGIGKSVIMSQLEDSHFKEDHALVLRGQCAPEHALGYGSAISQILVAWVCLAAASEDGREAVIRNAWQRCPAECQSTLMHVASLLDIHLYEFGTFVVSGLDKTVRRFCAWWASHFLGDQHILLIEDVHWLDELAGSCLHAILDAAPMVKCICSSRRSLSETKGLEVFKEYRLSGLNAQEMRQVMQAMLSLQVVDDDVVEHAMQLSSRKWYQIVGNGLILTLPTRSGSMARHDPPVALHLLIQSSVERLSADAKALVGVASTYGKEVSLPDLSKLCQGMFLLPPVLLECINQNILIKNGGEPQSARVYFGHALLQEACYARLDSASRSGMHLRIATVLEREQSIVSSTMERAWHWMGASVKTPEVIERVLFGAMWARKINAIDVALDMFEYVMAAYEEKGEKFVEQYKATALWCAITRCQKGKTVESTELLRKAAQLLYPARLVMVRAGIYFTRHACGFALRWVHKIVWPHRDGLLLAKDDPRSRSLLLLSEANYFQGDFEQFKWLAICALDAAERTRSTSDLISGYAAMAVHASRFGLWRLSNAYALLALDYARKSKDASLTVEALFFLALRDTGCARWQKVERHIALAMRRNQEYSSGRRHDELLVVKGYMLQGKEDYADTEQVFHLLWESGVARGDSQTAVWGLLGCARAAYFKGDQFLLQEYIQRLNAVHLPDILSELDVDALRLIQAAKTNDLVTCESVLQRWPTSRLNELARITFSVGFSLSIFFLVAAKLAFEQNRQRLICSNNPEKYLVIMKIHAMNFAMNESRYWICFAVHQIQRQNSASTEMALKRAALIASRLGQRYSLICVDQLRLYKSQSGLHVSQFMLNHTR
jgi:class 3 adenylate cyclase